MAANSSSRSPPSPIGPPTLTPLEDATPDPYSNGRFRVNLTSAMPGNVTACSLVGVLFKLVDITSRNSTYKWQVCIKTAYPIH